MGYKTLNRAVGARSRWGCIRHVTIVVMELERDER